MYTRIVVATGGSERSLTAQPVGAAASAAFEPSLELLHVPAAEDPPRLDTTGMIVRPTANPATGLIDHVTETLGTRRLLEDRHGGFFVTETHVSWPDYFR